MYAEFTGLVACRRDNTSLYIVPYSDRPASQIRGVPLLYGGEELIHIDMYDLPLCHSLAYIVSFFVSADKFTK